MIVGALAPCVMATNVVADVSENLKFCSSRSSSRERLACFEAIARGTGDQPATETTTRTTVNEGAMAAVRASRNPIPTREVAPPNSSFSGYYAAIGGGYGISTGRNASASSQLNYGYYALTPDSNPIGSGVIALAGFNIPVGSSGIAGVEFSGRFLGEETSKSASSTVTDYFTSQNFSGSAEYTFRNQAGFHMSFRAGATFEDWLIFGKVGLGASQIKETFTIDESSIPGLCRSASYYPSRFCYSYGPSGSRTALSTSSWLPSALLGIGIERNFGVLFARAAVDAEIFRKDQTSILSPGIASAGSSSQDGIMFSVRGMGAVGYRF